MVSKVKVQIGLDDKFVQDPELEQLLEKRQALKQSVSEYRQADKNCRKRLGSIQDPMPFRCGRFIISEVKLPAKSVSFDTDETTRIKINLVGK